MHEVIIEAEGRSAWAEWLESVPGRYLLDWEKRQFDAMLGDVFGFYALQLGLPQMDTLMVNRMPSRILAATHWLDQPGWPGYQTPAPVPDNTTSPAPAVEPSFTHRIVVERFEELPFAEQSLDLIVLPHVLEFANDPHQVLREVDRVLRPEGRVFVSGLNPISLWGAGHLLPRFGNGPALPRQARFIGLPRLRDWFKLLSFDVDQHHYGCYRPACQSQKWLDRMGFIERAGDRWWPICGAVYCVAAIKRVHAIRLIAPAWRTGQSKRRRVAVAVSSNRQRQTVDQAPTGQAQRCCPVGLT